MTEIIANHRNIYTCLQKGNRATVSHDVWGDSAFSQRGNLLGCDSDMLA